LICGRSRTLNNIRDSITTLQQLAFVKRREQPIGKSAGIQRGPEAISGTCKVMAHGGRVETRIDAAEQNTQVRRDHITNRLFSCGEKLFF